jgi:type II secretory pathway pseudopilin PulG
MKLNLRSRRTSLWPFSAIRKVGTPSPRPSPPGEGEELSDGNVVDILSRATSRRSPSPAGTIQLRSASAKEFSILQSLFPWNISRQHRSPKGDSIQRRPTVLSLLGERAGVRASFFQLNRYGGGEGRGEGGHLTRSLSTCQAFTMIEIAISLAIIGFALVAIIGILPTAMNAQRDNRQETIINQDASILMGALRNGERGLDDLTNYVVGITNYLSSFNRSGVYQNTTEYAFTVPMGYINKNPNKLLALTNGYTILGVLGTPKIIPNASGAGFVSNHVVAVFRSMSGPASEKPPQLNVSMQELALDYRVIADNSGYGTNYFDPGWTNYARLTLTNDIALHSNYMAVVKSFQTNLHDVRLTFLWPVLPSGKIGSGRQVYRTMVAGHYTNDPPGSPYFFYQPRTFF